MEQRRSYRASLIVAAAMAGSVLASGAAADSGVYDADGHDYRRWQQRTDNAYRRSVTRLPQASTTVSPLAAERA